jgi:SNF2 family DNA or RNA helicase
MIMKVSASQPFQIIYSLYQHEFLGYLFESFIVHLDDRGRLTYQHQNISAKNAREFARGLDPRDYELIALMDEMNQDVILKKYSTRQLKPAEFFARVYNKQKSQEPLREEIERYLEKRRANILEKIKGKKLFEMGSDGEPTWRKIEVLEKRASIQFHFKRGGESTSYHPSIWYDGSRVELPSPGAYLICKDPAWIVTGGKLYGFDRPVDGWKLQPFLQKKVVVIPRSMEEKYYHRFVGPLVAAFEHVEASGFEINHAVYEPLPYLDLSELPSNTNADAPDLFGNEPAASKPADENGKIVFDLSFKYGKHRFRGDAHEPVTVVVEKNAGSYVFHRVKRNLDAEKKLAHTLNKLGLPLKPFRCAVEKAQAFSWLNENRVNLLDFGFEIKQPESQGKKYFVGKAVFELEVRESIDWFDIHAVIRFGEFEIPFKDLRKLILRKKVEFKLPNGEIAIIPEAWLTRYGDLFSLSETLGDAEKPVLKKHHLNLLQELEDGNLARVQISEKFRSLAHFDGIKDYPMPAGFEGSLRPYQKAGYNWLRFLNDFHLGGCLADDMGLGKTVQTLALLLAEKEKGKGGASLLVMPTSLIYNWEMEASKFTPGLKILTYTGTQRNKDVTHFEKYDIVLTSYGIVRLDSEVLQQFFFNYIILDESQVIKNPTSAIARAVIGLKSRFRLTLTGTPLENTTLDLWSQMTFINPGLLGSSAFFRNEYLTPIEKKGDDSKAKKLHAVIKPFLLRRLKSQVATELPDKVENIHYADMLPEQEAKYEETKNFYRSKIFEKIDKEGIGNSRMVLLEGLTRLRQLSNHPRMVDPAYGGSSGKLEDLWYMLESALAENHKLLVFSQFVKHLDIVREMLHRKQIAYAYLDGSSNDRKDQVEKFNRDPNLKVFLISIKAGGLGLNLTQADYVFLLDPWWNPAVEAQAIDRAHRIGQTKQVFIYKFITRNTVEEKILHLQKRKVKLSDTLIQSEESVVKSLTREDIELLMQ